ncbi:PulJ/GspJ family protein [Roseateles sp. NT4]|uniref:PulJ/GspJ family protein n=1 Tax=Roseateles sp. NT4 TaxID=3453715 RepID=UPI003EE88FD7
MRTERGFTLIEAVLVIVLTGIVITIVSLFIVPASTAYFDSGARAQLGEQADTTLRRIARDLTGALPNSVRITGNSLELIPVSGAARYATDAAGALRFGVTPIPNFAIVGPPLKLSHASQQLAWYNLGAGTSDADAYTGSNVRTSTSAAGNALNVGVSGAALPNPLQAPPFRVYAIEPPVTYRCDLSARTLTRYSGYGFLAVQPNPPAGGTSALLARNVSGCSFRFDPAAVGARYGLVSLELSLQTRDPAVQSDPVETVTLYHAVHVDNLP